MYNNQKYLVFGASGMLGRRVMDALTVAEGENGEAVIALERARGLTSKDCDIADSEAVMATVREAKPDVIINCAAYTAVDKAEDDEEAADKVNHIGPANIAAAAREVGALLIHISTDYVFDGKATEPYTEDMPTAPLGVYGRTKLEGERAIMASGCKHIIIRTQWLYDSQGSNFLLTMLRLFGEKERLNVVADQTGSPTWAADLAKAVAHIAVSYKGQDGVYQYSDDGECTWYDFATSIAQLAKATTRLLPVSTNQYPTRATRPHYSVLSKAKIVVTFGVKVPHWRKALSKCFKAIDS